MSALIYCAEHDAIVTIAAAICRPRLTQQIDQITAGACRPLVFPARVLIGNFLVITVIRP
jgi:hypothetical protein